VDATNPITARATNVSKQKRRAKEQRAVSPEGRDGFGIGDAESRELAVWVKQISEMAVWFMPECHALSYQKETPGIQVGFRVL